MNIVDVGGHMRSPFDTAVSRKLVGGSPNDASIVASKWIGDHVGDLTTRPFLESVFDGVLRIKAFSFTARLWLAVALQACQFNTVDVTLEKVAFQLQCVIINKSEDKKTGSSMVEESAVDYWAGGVGGTKNNNKHFYTMIKWF